MKVSTSDSGSSCGSREFENALELYNTLRNCNDTYISNHINQALDTLLDALRLYDPHHVFSSYNGGKDAAVIMHLLRAAYAKYSHDHINNNNNNNNNAQSAIYQPQSIYFTVTDEFPEVVSEMNQSREKYSMNVTQYNNGILKGIGEHITSVGDTKPCAFVLGTRKGDPNAVDQETFTPSSSWMPPFMRVNPILKWEYGHVWHFLRMFDLSYCRLYDQGYTSLGKVTNTLPNPLLRIPAGKSDHSDEFLPAYLLADWGMERLGRETNANSSISSTINGNAASFTYKMIVMVDEKELMHAIDRIKADMNKKVSFVVSCYTYDVSSSNKYIVAITGDNKVEIDKSIMLLVSMISGKVLRAEVQ